MGLDMYSGALERSRAGKFSCIYIGFLLGLVDAHGLVAALISKSSWACNRLPMTGSGIGVSPLHQGYRVPAATGQAELHKITVQVLLQLLVHA